MSGFDEEAERERLREKYERDREKRTATQRMSELLLKGATMTNRHCDACGDPIFRHDGQEFCPTCQAEGRSAAAADAAVQDGDAADAETGAESGDVAGAETGAESGDAVATDAAPSIPDPAGPTPPNDVEAGTERGSRSGADRSLVAGDGLTEVRASLSRTLARYAQAAEETDDPRRAKELLGAAREAAETLAALDRR